MGKIEDENARALDGFCEGRTCDEVAGQWNARQVFDVFWQFNQLSSTTSHFALRMSADEP